MATIFLHAMFRNADGSLSGGGFYIFGLAVIMGAAGIWSLVAPESFRAFYFDLLRNIRRNTGSGSRPLPRAWGWSSPGWVRFWGGVEIALAVGAMSLVMFVAVPGRVY
jgi:hypothetical protein